jgi:hypothetical protein
MLSRSLAPFAVVFAAACGPTAPPNVGANGACPPGTFATTDAYGQVQCAPVTGGTYGPGAQTPQGPTTDFLNEMNQDAMRTQAGVIMGQLIQALDPNTRSLVQGIPFEADPAPGEINAYAGCDEQRLPFMAITDSLLEVQAYLAQFKATDEIFGTQKTLQYYALVSSARPGSPLPRPPAGMIDPAQHGDPRKVARQQQLYDEAVGFVLGHELAHHYLQHTGCATGKGVSRGVSTADLGRLASRVVPVLNQPNEIAADTHGTQNLLSAGKTRPSYQWTEGGALETLNMFQKVDQSSPTAIIFAFEQSHPNPAWRMQWVQQAANQWRQNGGVASPPQPGFPFPFPLPIPGLGR